MPSRMTANDRKKLHGWKPMPPLPQCPHHPDWMIWLPVHLDKQITKQKILVPAGRPTPLSFDATPGPTCRLGTSPALASLLHCGWPLANWIYSQQQQQDNHRQRRRTTKDAATTTPLPDTVTLPHYRDFLEIETIAEQSHLLLHGWLEHVPLAQDPWTSPWRIWNGNLSVLPATSAQIPLGQEQPHRIRTHCFRSIRFFQAPQQCQQIPERTSVEHSQN